MRQCIKCGRQNPDDADFCECGMYLRWEPTGAQPAVPPPGSPPSGAGDDTEPIGGEEQPTPDASAAVPPTPPVPVDQPDAVTLALRVSEDSDANDAAGLRCEAGGSARLIATLRNQSGIVDNYQLAVEGVPAEWVTTAPATVYLVPFGAAAGDYEQDVEIRVAVPHSPQAEARTWPLRVTATSAAQSRVVAAAPAALTIEPYVELSAEMRPERGSGRRQAGFAVAVRNLANAPCEVEVSATDADNACTFRFDATRFVAQPGHRGGTGFTVQAPKQMWFGRPVDRRFELVAKAVSSDAAAPTQLGTFRQKPWFPWWTPLAVPVAIAAVVAGVLLLTRSGPKQVVVPDLVGQRGTARAQAKLAGLGLVATISKQQNDAKKGLITGQVPKAGSKLDVGKPVTVFYAVGSGNAPVPNVVGQNLGGATKLLGCFTVAPLSPQPAADAKVLTQSPAGGAQAADCSPVQLFFASSSGGSGGGGSSGSSAPPASVAGLSAAAALTALTAAGVQAVEVDRFDTTVGAGKVISSTPTNAPPVTVFVSLGKPPPVAYDTNGRIVLQNGASAPRVLLPGPLDFEPAWSPDGRLLYFRRDSAANGPSRIYRLNTQTSAPPIPVTNAGFYDHRPAISPDGNTLLFARASMLAGPYSLCLKRLTPPSPVRCLPVPSGYSVVRPAWSPDGKAIVASALATTAAPLIEYVSNQPSAFMPSKWHSLGFVDGPNTHTQAAGDQVWYSAFSPNGRVLAVSANWGTGQFHLLQIPVGPTGALGVAQSILTQPVAVPGCEFSWRPDGAVLAANTPTGTGCGSVSQLVAVDLTANTSQPLAGTAQNPAWRPKTTP